MNPIDYSQQSDDYRRIEKAIRFIESHFKSRPTLDQIAGSVNLSRFHFDRLFKRWAGTTRSAQATAAASHTCSSSASGTT